MTVLVPAADLAPSLASRLVTITIASMTEGAVDGLAPTVSFRLYGDIHVGADRVIVASLPAPVIVDLSTGSASIRLPVFDGRFGGQWAIAVKKSWAPHEYLIRIPSGTGPIDLSELAPLGPLDLAGGLGPGGQIGTGGLPPGGVLGDVLLVTSEGLQWAKLADLYDSARFGLWATGGKTTLVNSSRYESFPVACQMSTGRIVMAWQSLEQHAGGPSSHGKIITSTDDGATWTTAYTIKAATAGQYWVPVGIAAHDTRVAMLLYTFTPGVGRQGFVQVSSSPQTAAGWSPMVRVQWTTTDYTFACGLTWLDDGTTNGLLLAIAYGGSGTYISASRDAGATWAPHSGPFAGYSEASIVQIGSRLAMACRDDLANVIVVMHSDDWGVTWTMPRTAVAYASGLPTLTRMRDGTILMTIRDLAGLGLESWSLAYSRDDGMTWTKSLISDEWMMYGQVVQLKSGPARLFGANQIRGVSTDADVWMRRLTLSPGRVVDAVAVDQLRADTYMATGTPYAPVWYGASSGNPLSIGNGSLTGRYVERGKWVWYSILLIRGSTTNAGDASYAFTLPVAPRAYREVQGAGYITYSTSSEAPVTARGIGSNRIAIISPAGRVSNAVPGSWSADNEIYISGFYERA